MKDLFYLLLNKLKHLLSLNEDAASEKEVVSGIESGVEFRGAKLWILVLAVFVASLGLNTNSAAVIIGAMLISPLMGPIIGMGLGMGIYDFELLKRSFRNYVVATLFSVVTATLYFLITPYSEAQSELLARTSPTIYDVLIALCGGLAGIIALGSKSQRTGNVIPGVAIATALMPPLCTVGFGLATWNLQYALGALYLFVINTIFISLATFVGARWIMRFHTKVHLDKEHEKRVRYYITALLIITIIPSIFLTIGMVRESYFNQQVNHYIQQELHWPMTQVVSHKNDFDNQSFSVVLIGAEIDSTQILVAQEKLPYYGLAGVDMQILQATNGINEEDIQLMMNQNNRDQHHNEALLAQQQVEINDLQRALDTYKQVERLSTDVLDELHLLYPQVRGVSMARGYRNTLSNVQNDSLPKNLVTDELLVIIDVDNKLKQSEIERIESWLRLRMDEQSLRMEIHIN